MLEGAGLFFPLDRAAYKARVNMGLRWDLRFRVLSKILELFVLLVIILGLKRRNVQRH